MKTSTTPHALDLGDAIDAGLPAAALQRMALVYQQVGVWSPEMTINEEGHTLAQAWLLSETRNSSGPRLNEEIGTWLLSLQPLDVLWKGKAYGRPLDHMLLKSMIDQNARKEFLLSRTLWEALPLENLRRFEWYSTVQPSSIMAFAVARDRADLVEFLLEKGWDWNHSSGGTIATSIASPAMWEVFLSSGGDPRQQVTRGDPETFRGPLWQYLAQVAGAHTTESKALQEIALEYGKTVAPSMIEAHVLKRYWENLDQVYGLQPLESTISSQKNWDKLLNEKGQNVLMVAMKRHPGIVKKLAAKKKALPLFSHVDNRGWSLWHYMMANKDREIIPLSDWTEVRAHAPKQPDPSKGLISALLLDNPLKFNQFAFGYPKGLFEKADVLTPDQMWGGSPENQDAAARVLLGDEAYLGSSGSRSKVVENLGRLLKDCPPPASATPLLRGAVATYALLVTNYSECASKELVDKTIQSGAAVEMTPKFREAFDGARNDSTFIQDAVRQMESNFRALQLTASLPKPLAASPKPRF